MVLETTLGDLAGFFCSHQLVPLESLICTAWTGSSCDWYKAQPIAPVPCQLSLVC